MLPGLRFLLAAILLSTSILVFGVGAASLLRASHEQYVNNPAWRNGPQEQVFAQAPEPAQPVLAPEPAQPVLAALRVEPVAEVTEEATPSIQDQIPSIALPAVETDPEQMAAVTLESQPETQLPSQIAAIAPPAETAPPATEAPVPEPAKVEAATPTPTDTLTPAGATVSIAAPPPPAAMSATDVPRTATPALASRVNDIAAARLAALNELATTTAGKDAPAKPKAAGTTRESKPRAHKPKKRHRVVQRPPPQQVNQALDPFGQPQQTLATTTARTR